MKVKAIFKKKKSFIKYLIFFVAVLCIISTLIFILVSFQVDEVSKIEVIDKEQNLIQIESKILENQINLISNDLLFVEDCVETYDDGSGDYSEIEEILKSFSDRMQIYDKIRYIDLNGNEVFNIHYTDDGAVIISEDELDNKDDLYYFEETLDLEENQIYISKVELSITDDEVDDPIKPILRVSMKYYDSDGELKGIIILNYLVDDVLSQIEEVSKISDNFLFLINSDGYWLFNDETIAYEWAFMYDEESEISFSNIYEDEWEKIINDEEGWLVSDNGVFVFYSINAEEMMPDENNGYSYVFGIEDGVLIGYVSNDSIDGILFNQSPVMKVLNVIENYAPVYLFPIGIAFIITLLLINNKNKAEQIKFYSEYDNMTGVYNRRAGIEKLRGLHKNARKNSFIYSICFIDINGLKNVNDELGHEAGDELIISVIEGIKKNIRKNDIVARFGGDEFIIIFEGLTEPEAEDIWKRIVEEYNHINETEDRSYIISASHGIESIRCENGKQLDDIINQADIKMYTEKRNIKKELNVIRKKMNDKFM